MNTKVFLVPVCIALIILTSFSTSVAEGDGPTGPEAPDAPLGTSITYQGRLTDADALANHPYDFRFILYNADSGGSQVGSTLYKDDIMVIEGLFTIELDFGASVFNGEALWLEVSVRPGDSLGAYTVLSPRQKITAAPYALNAETLDGIDGASLQLRVSGICTAGNAIRVINANGTVSCEPVASPGHTHWGAGWSGSGTGLTLTSSDGTGLLGRSGSASPHTPWGQAIWGDSSTQVGVLGTSGSYAGVAGRSNTWDGVIGNSMGGASAQSGVLGYTNSTNSGMGGVFGRSVDAAAGVYGEAQASGIGLYGISTGGAAVYGNTASSSHYGGYFSGAAGVFAGSEVSGADGIYAVCNSGGACYGVNVYSGSSIAVYGNTNEASQNYGLYTPDNAFAHGYYAGLGMALVAQNNGSEPLQVGDLVAVAGIGSPVLGSNTPVLQVKKAVEGSPGEVIGVVQSAFRIENVVKSRVVYHETEASTESDPGNSGGKGWTEEVIEEQVPMQVSASGPVQPGDMMFIQVQGMAQVRVSAGSGAIRPGDLLSVSPQGIAQRAEPTLALDGVTLQYTAGTILGKALEASNGGDGLIWVFMDLR